MIGFIRNFLSSVLKDNINIEKAMITGILRVAKESIFSGLNNLEVYTILSRRYSDKFGFTEDETIEETLDIALKQIKDKKYDTELIKRGINNIVKMAIVFHGKIVHIKTM